MSRNARYFQEQRSGRATMQKAAVFKPDDMPVVGASRSGAKWQTNRSGACDGVEPATARRRGVAMIHKSTSESNRDVGR
jgi:hypothetical protein